MIDISMDHASSILDKWIDILRLQHWDISLKLLSEAEYVLRHGNKSNAIVNLTHVKYDARITINKASDDTFEHCLVHELVHIILGGFDAHFDYSTRAAGERQILDFFRDDEIEKVTHVITRALLEANKTGNTRENDL